MSVDVNIRLRMLPKQKLFEQAVEHFLSISNCYLELITKTTLVENKLLKRFNCNNGPEARVIDIAVYDQAKNALHSLTFNLKTGIYFLHGCPEQCMKNDEQVESSSATVASTSSQAVSTSEQIDKVQQQLNLRRALNKETQTELIRHIGDAEKATLPDDNRAEEISMTQHLIEFSELLSSKKMT